MPELLNIRHALNWLLAGLLCITTLILPINWQLSLGGLIGKVGWQLGHWGVIKGRLNIIKTNLQICFGNTLSKPQIEAMEKEVWQNLGKGVFEVAMCFWLPNYRLKKIVHIQGIEHIKKAQKSNKAIIFLPAHFTPMFLVGRMLNQKVPMQIIYYPQSAQVLHYLIKARFKTHGVSGVIKGSEIRKMVKSLQQKESLWLPCDQDYSNSSTTFAPFFGQTTATITTYARLSQMTGAVMLPVFMKRVEKDKKIQYRIEIGQELKITSQDKVAQATSYNEMIEKMVRQNPSQYLFSHRRFKTQPDLKQIYDEAIPKH